MKKLKIIIKNKLRAFLGINETDLALNAISQRYARMEKTWEMATSEIQDVGFRDNTKIIIATNLGQGFCKVYDLKFDNYREVIEFSKHLESRQVRANSPYIDAPYDYQPTIDGMRRDYGMSPRKGR